MKPLLLLSFIALPALAAERWFELRCGESLPQSSYAVPPGKVIQIMSIDAKPGALTFSVDRPEGRVTAVPVASDVTQLLYGMGPLTMNLTYLGSPRAGMSLYTILIREFDAVSPGPVVNLTLESSTNLPAFKPAATFFRAKEE